MSVRAHIPILVKVLVVRRQLKRYGVKVRRRPRQSFTSYFEEIFGLLKSCMDTDELQLDHSPALGLRKKIVHPDGRITYKPRENDHRCLEYRIPVDHLEKTIGRKPGAERTVTTKGSDIHLIAKFRRLEGPKRRKAKIPSRPFPKRRKYGLRT